jgi:glycosyltransferase involved in cell wall biosynthesis
MMRIAEVWGTPLSEVELDKNHWLQGDDTYHQLARRRVARGHANVVCHLEFKKRESGQRDGVQYEFFPVFPSSKKKSTTSTAMLEFLNQWKPDVVMLHSANRLQTLLCLQHPIPETVYILDSNSAAVQGRVMDEIARDHHLVQGCIFKAKIVRDEFCARSGYPECKTRILPSGIDINQFSPQSVEKDLDCIWTGYIRENNFRKKNLSFLLEVFQRLSFRITIVGQGKMEDKLRSQASANVTFTGFANHSLLPTLLSKHKIFLLPSLYDPAPRSLSEALACGLPAIGLEKGYGTEEQIIDGINGYRVRTPDETSQAIQKLINNKLLRLEMGQASRKIAVKSFNLYRIDEELETFLTHILN